MLVMYAYKRQNKRVGILIAVNQLNQKMNLEKLYLLVNVASYPFLLVLMIIKKFSKNLIQKKGLVKMDLSKILSFLNIFHLY